MADNRLIRGSDWLWIGLVAAGAYVAYRMYKGVTGTGEAIENALNPWSPQNDTKLPIGQRVWNRVFGSPEAATTTYQSNMKTTYQSLPSQYPTITNKSYWSTVTAFESAIATAKNTPSGLLETTRWVGTVPSTSQAAYIVTSSSAGLLNYETMSGQALYVGRPSVLSSSSSATPTASVSKPLVTVATPSSNPASIFATPSASWIYSTYGTGKK